MFSDPIEQPREQKRAQNRRWGPKQVEIPEAPTPEQRQKLLDRAMFTAVWHINRSPKTEAEIDEKLRRKGFTDEYIKPTIKRLLDIHLLNDQQYAENFVLSRKGVKGATAIRQDLRRKGIDPEEIEEILEENLTDDEQEQAARALARKRIRSLPANLDYQKKVNRVAGALIRRGFSPGIVFGIVKEEIEEAAQAIEESGYYND